MLKVPNYARTKLATAFFASMIASEVTAQTAPTGQRVVALEEMVVTAQRREESLQETPIAITAFGASDLETQQITNVMDLADKVPSLVSVPFAGLRIAPNLFIRGMGNLNSQSTNDMAIGIYIDGVPLGRGVGLATDIADLERVEVLRGPQGTLWGRNTTAGAISMITRRPNDELSGKVQLTAASRKELGGRASVNVPVSDDFYIRASYMRIENDGWVKNRNTTFTNQINFYEDDKKEAYKISARYNVMDNFVLDYDYDKSIMDYGNFFFQIVDGPLKVSGRQEHANPQLGQYPSNAEVFGHALTATWEFGDTTIKTISAYRELDSKSYTNFIDLFSQDRTMDQDQLSQEIQLFGEMLDGNLNYVTGLFYFKEHVDETTLSSFAGGLLLDDWAVQAKAESAAIYGQLSWTPPILNEKLEIILGLRYTRDTRSATKVFVNPGFTPEITGLVLKGRTRFNSTDPMLTLTYSFTDNISGYAKYSTGYRAGGFNTQSTPSMFSQGYAQEDVKSFEVGVKSSFLENRAQLNMAVFSNTYTDLQVDQERNPPVFVDTLNAGKASMSGFEIEGTAILYEGLMVNLYAAYLDAKYKSYIDGGVDIKSIRAVPNSPKWQFGGSVSYEFPKTELGYVTANLDFRAQDESYGNPKRDTLFAGYSFWNARVEVAEIPAVKTGDLKVALWCKNITDREYKIYLSNLGYPASLYGLPRTFGLDVSYEF